MSIVMLCGRRLLRAEVQNVLLLPSIALLARWLADWSLAVIVHLDSIR